MREVNKFGGTALDQLEVGLDQVLSHAVDSRSVAHLLSFHLDNLEFASIRCSSCRVIALTGSREFVESIWLEWSMKSDS